MPRKVTDEGRSGVYASAPSYRVPQRIMGGWQAGGLPRMTVDTD